MNAHLLLSAGLLSLSLTINAAQHQHWGYKGDNSPQHWGSLSEAFSVCDIGKNQSPVDLKEAIKTDIRSVQFSYQPQSYKAENNGHTLQISPLSGSQKIEIGSKTFELKQFHFHTPSEHTFKGKNFPMEAHFVHQTASGEIAVLAVIFREGGENAALTPVIAKRLAVNESAELPAKLDISGFLPTDREHFRLNGSLTTPPCSEGVNWVIFKVPVTVSKAQIAAMRAILGQDNNRPVQPINSRIVIEETK